MKYNSAIDEFFTLKYSDTISEEGRAEIERIINSATSKENETEALRTIAQSITSNFTNPWWDNGTHFWANQLGGPLDFNHAYFSGVKYGYGYDKYGNLRALANTQFHNNANWIAYMRTGACQELAVLFNETANATGFTTRVVWNPTQDHVWTEVKINGTWIYADPDCYHNKGDMKWLGETRDYCTNCINFNRESKIYVFPSTDMKDDITDSYYCNSIESLKEVI